MKKIENLLAPYDIAVLAKERMFNEDCFGLFNAYKELRFDYLGMWPNNINFRMPPVSYTAAPTYQQLTDWFREKHKLCIDVTFDFVTDNEFDCVCIGMDGTFYASTLTQGKDYYACLSETIRKSFEHIK